MFRSAITIASAVLLGAMAVSAAPVSSSQTSVSAAPVSTSQTSVSTAHVSSSQTSVCPAASSGPTVPKLPAANVPDQTAILAQGTLPNGAPPKTLHPDSIAALQFIAFNEHFEVAYFAALLSNITNNVPGFIIAPDTARTFVLRTLAAVLAQEQLHVTGANAILTSVGATPIQACQYKYPVATFQDSIGLASTFTDVTLGTLQEIQKIFAVAGDTPLVPLLGSIIGQEGEQNGWYRSLNNHIPSALPFLTQSARQFAFSAINQAFVVPGSCPNAQVIQLPIFGALALNTANIQAKDQTLQFTITNTGGMISPQLSLVYINQLNTPIVVPLQNIVTVGQTATFSAVFPYTANLLNGLTIAAVTKTAGPFMSASDVALATVFGPALIEIN